MSAVNLRASLERVKERVRASSHPLAERECAAIDDLLSLSDEGLVEFAAGAVLMDVRREIVRPARSAGRHDPRNGKPL